MEKLKYIEILKLNKELVGTIHSTPYEIAVLSNVSLNSFKDVLEYSCRLHQVEPRVTIGNFDNIVQDSALFNQKNLVIIFYDVLNIVDQISDIFEDIDEGKYIGLKNKLFAEFDILFENLKNTASVIFNSFSSSYYTNSYVHQSRIDLFVDELNTYIKEKKTSNVTILNIDKLFKQIGIKNAIDFRFYNSSKAPYTFAFLKNYVSAIENVFLRKSGKLRKAIIFDCDNTLWNGIIGEDGIENIDMSPESKVGKYFHKVQQIAVLLSKRGIIVGLCSKNNEQDVLEVLRTHKEMVLKQQYIVPMKINWQDKATNLCAIAHELNIGIDSLVFVDDSAFEINLVKEQLPEVLTIQVPEVISGYPELILQKAYTYFNLESNSEDAHKTEMYKQQFKREISKANFQSIDDYLASLEIQLTIVKNDRAFIPRIAQLTQKTNQFNLTSFRYTETQVEHFMQDERYRVYALFVKDKFGDNGLTGVCVVKVNDEYKNQVELDSFLMSCRIIGRNIELVFLNCVINSLKTEGYEIVVAEYIPTKKNAQVENFYERFGMSIAASAKGRKQYSTKFSDIIHHKVDYIKLNFEQKL
jgi:FkbH-like protein